MILSTSTLRFQHYFFRWLTTDSRDALFYSFFKIGSLSITPIFLIKGVGFLILLITLSRLVQRLVVNRLLNRLNLASGLKFAIGRFATYLFFLGGLFIGVQSLGVNLDSLVIFGGALGVGVGLGLQNVVSNFVAGLILLIEQPIRIGDRIETTGILGDVVKIAARSTWIRTNDNVVIIVPNNKFIDSSVTNWTANDPNVRVSLDVGVSYASDPELVRTILLQASADHPKVLKDPAPDVVFTGYGDNSINFQLRIWTASMPTPPPS